MRAGLRGAVVPVFLLLCLLLGGSRQGEWSNAALQLLAVLLLAWAATADRDEPLARASRQLLALAVAAVALTLAQLIPWPPSVWRGLPAGETLESGFAMLGYERPWLPLSIAPYDTLQAAYTLLPPLAVVAVIVARRARESWIAAAVLAGALASVLLGAVQVASAGRATWAYLYDITNPGAVGFFANRNHMATLLLAAIPFAGALFASRDRRAKSGGKDFGMLSLGAVGFVLALAGLALNDSLAALALAVPVIAMTGLMLPIGWRWRWLLLPLSLIALVVAVLALSSSTLGIALPQGESGLGRADIWQVTLRLIGDTFPFGTGFGTYPQVYALGEDPGAIGRAYVNHAHNDYLELVVEAGVMGLLLMVLFLAWWGRQAVRIWRSPLSTPFAKAATIASGAILAHSIVDYPLRTTAIAALFAACIAIMAEAVRRRADAPRHVRIG